MKCFHVHGTFLCLLDLSMLTQLFEANALFSFSWNFSMLILHFYKTFPYLLNLFMLTKPLNIFSCLWNFSILMKLFQAYESFSSLWNFFILVRLFHAHRTFPCLQKSFIFMDSSIHMEPVHGCGTCPCWWNFWILVELLNAFEIFLSF